MANILVLHGPNLNLLGLREQSIYGKETVAQLNKKIMALAQELGHTVVFFQSNAEHELIDTIHQSNDSMDFILFNPAAYTHTSIALRDALLAVKKPFIEIHLSNIHQREAFRQFSYFSDIAIGSIVGLGTAGYLLGLRYAHDYLNPITPLEQ